MTISNDEMIDPDQDYKRYCKINYEILIWINSFKLKNGL